MIRTFVAIKTVEAAAKAKSLRFLQGRAYQCAKFDRFFLRQPKQKKSTVETIIDGTILIFVFSVCFTTFLLFSVVSSIFRFDVKSWLDDFMSAFLMRNGNDDFSK